MTNSNAVSEVVNDLRALVSEDRISSRYVLSKLRYFLGQYLKRENDTLRLYYYDYIWTTIQCVAMEEIDASLCLGTTIPKVTRYMQSTMPIPELYSYKNGPLIKEVLSVDEGSVFQPSSPIDFLKITKREFPGSLQYYWFRNGHLILPNGPSGVHFTGCFIEQSKALSLATCNPISCPNYMEDQFPCPPHLFEIVRQETVKDLFNFYKRIVNDNIPDLDSNTKTEKPNAGST